MPRGISSKFGVYNVTRRQWEYKDIEFAPPAYGLVVDNLPQIHGDKVYHTVDRWITCHELATGREVWKQRFDGNFMFGGFVVVNGVLAANCEDLFLYGLDAQTGRRVWKTPSSGTASPMSVLNGVAYYSGGGDGHLYAVEVATGRTLWRLDSPDLKTSSAAFFYAAVAAVPGRDGGHGVVVAHTGLNVYGFEAAR